MSNIKIFENKEFGKIRVQEINSEIWFVAKDIMEMFQATNRNRIMQDLDEDEKGYTQINTPGGKQKMSIVNEAGLYNLIFAMTPTKARGVSDEYIILKVKQLKQFKRWVTHEVLPSIRKSGGYIQNQENLTDNEIMAKALLVAQNVINEKNKMLEVQRPKVLFAESVETSKTSILIGELAKILKQNGYEIGQNRLFEWLRNNGYLTKRKGTDYNMPTQKAMELGLFQIKETSVTHSDGHISVNKTTKVTGKGQVYFINKFITEEVKSI